MAYSRSVAVARCCAEDQGERDERHLCILTLVRAYIYSPGSPAHEYRGLHNPSPGVFDFTGWQDWQLFLDIAKQVGLWVVFRPGKRFDLVVYGKLIRLGPYINAETTGGGIPGQ